MRLLFALLFLLTPLRGVTAAAICVAGGHGREAVCEPGMAEAGGENGHGMAPEAGSPAQLAHLAGADLGAGPGLLTDCGAPGLCATTLPSIAGSIVEIPPENLAAVHPVPFARLLGPGTRPAPPITPPRA